LDIALISLKLARALLNSLIDNLNMLSLRSLLSKNWENTLIAQSGTLGRGLVSSLVTSGYASFSKKSGLPASRHLQGAATTWQ
jgi:hypothetical protein